MEEKSKTPRADAWRDKMARAYGSYKDASDSMLNLLADLHQAEEEIAQLRAKLDDRHACKEATRPDCA